MKIISAIITVRLDGDSDVEAVGKLDEVFAELPFDGKLLVTSIPDDTEDNIAHIRFETSK